MLDQIFPINSKRVLRQKDTPIRVVLGNPPYSSGQSSANDNNANLSYPRLDQSIANSYVEHSTATLKNSLYDSYIRAFRWASDRIGDEGIVAYVSNGGWLDGNAMDGFRRCLAEEFSVIYCFNLRGNARTSGEQRRKEKGNVFGEGTRTNVAILLLVKKKDATGACQIRYHDIGDYLDRKQKLDTIRGFGSIRNMEERFRPIIPNVHHDWINQRSQVFLNFLPLGDKDNKRNKGIAPSIFTLYSNGLKSNRDSWVYNFSKNDLVGNMEKTIAFYNNELQRYTQECEGKENDNKPSGDNFVDNDSSKISWSSTLIAHLVRGSEAVHDTENFRKAVYRPFNKMDLYSNNIFLDRPAIINRCFPKPDTQNLAICVSGIGASKEFSALMVDTLPDLEIVSKSQCFPRYRYISAEARGQQTTLSLGETKHTRVDNIPEETVSRFQSHYRDKTIDADAIFYYVYGLLHSHDYKTRFAADLKKMLPRIPLVANLSDFRAFSDAGKELAGLHVGYEEAEGWPVTIREKQKKQEKQDDPDDDERFQVKKMGFGGTPRTPDKTTISYNNHVTVEGIPLMAYEYVVNGKSAIEWVMERYQVAQHKDSKIVNDPNTWSDHPRYILELLQKVVTVSMKTVEIVSGLPELGKTE